MVKENFLNLVKELERIKGFKLALFTTYSFDAIFFDHVVFRKIRRNNPYMKIVVLVDADHYPKTTELTKSTGIEYLLLPVPHSLFHPKIFLFLAEKKALAYIGSHNLTPSGITHNLELTYKTQNQYLVSECIKFFRLLFSMIFDQNEPIIMTLSEFEKKLEYKNMGNPKVHLIHNLERPILQTCLDYVEKRSKTISEIVIFAPFFSKTELLLEQINDKIKTNQIHLCIQRNNHNLDTQNLSDLGYVSFKEVVPKEERNIHSKFILFNGKEKFALVGSPNFTDPALNRTTDKGNVEVALLMNLEEKTIFGELDFRNINESEVRSTTRRDFQHATPIIHYKANILMASIGQLGQLDIRIEPETEYRDFILVIETPEEKVEFPIAIESNSRHIHVPVRISGPTTIWFEENGQRVSNKIRTYNPTGMALRFSGHGTDTKTILNLIPETKDMEGIIQAIAALLPRENSSTKGTPSKPHIPEPGLGLIHSTHTESSILDILLDLLRVPRKTIERKTPRKKGITKSKETGQLIEGSDTSNYVFKEFYQYFPTLFNKWTKAFCLRKLASDNSIINYSAYLIVSLKLIDIYAKSSKDAKKLPYFNSLLQKLPSMIEEYGMTSKKEDLLLFISIVLYLKSETVQLTKRSWDFEINPKIVKKLADLDSMLFSAENPLKSTELREQVLEKISEFKLPTSGYIIPRKLIAALVAAMVLNKKEELRLKIINRLINSISKTTSDLDALFACEIMQFLSSKDTDNRKKIKSEILSRTKDQGLRHFRRVLFLDILKTM